MDRGLEGVVRLSGSAEEDRQPFTALTAVAE